MREKKLGSVNKSGLILIIKRRCLLEGCRFGYPFINKEPLTNCIYCGEPAKVPVGAWSETDELPIYLGEMGDCILPKNKCWGCGGLFSDEAKKDHHCNKD